MDRLDWKKQVLEKTKHEPIPEIFKTKTMKQNERLLEYLQNFEKINPLEAWRKLGIYRLSAVVFRLRQDGHDVITNRKSILNQFNEKCSFAEYTLTTAPTD